ncbi:MAG: hypothetical protein IT450_09835 [Phycisphaerales bacterium]|nr:hypothetical protein [Phycisphaerales bacterium]
MRTKTAFAAILAAAAVGLAFGQAAGTPAQPQEAPEVSLMRVLAGVRDFTPDALKSMAVLGEHREWLEMASKAIQAGGKPDLGDPKMPAPVKEALETFADVPELVLLLAARPNELAALRQVVVEAPEGVALRMQQFRADYSYARREGAIAWQRMLQRDPVALGQYREYLTKFCETQQKAIPGFAVVRVTDRDYYLASPPDDAIMTFAHEASPPEALGRIMAEWWDEHGTAAVDEMVVDRSVAPQVSMVQGAVIDLPAERRQAMWRPADKPAMDTLGLMPVILQPFADQPDQAKVARAVQELARVWSMGDGAPEDAPPVAVAEPRAPVVAPEPEPAVMPDIPVEELARRADAEGPYTVLEPRYTWPGITTFGLSSYRGFCYTPYSPYISGYSYINGYPYWYSPPPNCGTTYIYYPQCRPTFSYLRDACDTRDGVSFGIHTSSGIRRYGFSVGGGYYDNDCGRRYGVYQYGGRYGRDWRGGLSARQRWGEDGVAIKDRRGHDAPGGNFGIDRGTRRGPDDPREGERAERRGAINRLGHLPWSTNGVGRGFSTRGDRRADDGARDSGRSNGQAQPPATGSAGREVTPQRRTTIRNPWASPRTNSGVSPRSGSSGGSRVNPSVAPRNSPSNERRATGARSSAFDNLRSIRQNWNSRPAQPNRSESNFGAQRSGSTPRAQSGTNRPIVNKLQTIRQNLNSRSSSANRSSSSDSRKSSSSGKRP